MLAAGAMPRHRLHLSRLQHTDLAINAINKTELKLITENV